MDGSYSQTTALFHSLDRVRRAWRAIAPCENLTKTQFDTLLGVFHMSGRPSAGEGAAQPVPLSELAPALALSLPALSQRVRALEDLGCVERVPDPADRRITGLRLTPKGFEVLLEARQRVDRILSEAIRRLGPDAETLIRTLDEVAAILEDPSLSRAEGGPNG